MPKSDFRCISAERVRAYYFYSKKGYHPRYILESVENDSCHYLDLSNNAPLASPYWFLFERIFPAIQRSTVLKDFSLRGNRLGNPVTLKYETFEALRKAIANNTSLIQIDLSDNLLCELHNTGLKLLLDALDTNQSLRYINLEENSLEKRRDTFPQSVIERWDAYNQWHTKQDETSYCFAVPDLSLKLLWEEIQHIFDTEPAEEAKNKTQKLIIDAIHEQIPRLADDKIHSQLLLAEYFRLYYQFSDSLAEEQFSIEQATKYLMLTPSPCIYYHWRNPQIEALFNQLRPIIASMPSINVANYLNIANTEHQHYCKLLALIGFHLIIDPPADDESPSQKQERLALAVCVLNAADQEALIDIPLLPLYNQGVGFKGMPDKETLLMQKKEHPEKFSMFDAMLKIQQEKYNLPASSTKLKFLAEPSEVKDSEPAFETRNDNASPAASKCVLS